MVGFFASKSLIIWFRATSRGDVLFGSRKVHIVTVVCAAAPPVSAARRGSARTSRLQLIVHGRLLRSASVIGLQHGSLFAEAVAKGLDRKLADGCA